MAFHHQLQTFLEAHKVLKNVENPECCLDHPHSNYPRIVCECTRYTVSGWGEWNLDSGSSGPVRNEVQKKILHVVRSRAEKFRVVFLLKK